MAKAASKDIRSIHYEEDQNTREFEITLVGPWGRTEIQRKVMVRVLKALKPHKKQLRAMEEERRQSDGD